MNQDKTVTLIITLQEVSQRLLANLIGNRMLTHELKHDFNFYLKTGIKFRKKYEQLIKFVHDEVSVEHNEQDADHFYDLLNNFYDLDIFSATQAIKRIKTEQHPHIRHSSNYHTSRCFNHRHARNENNNSRRTRFQRL